MRRLLQAIALGCAVVSVMIAELNQEPNGLDLYSSGDYLNAEFRSTLWSVGENIAVFSPSPNVREITPFGQSQGVLSIQNKNGCRDLSSRGDNRCAVAASVAKIGERVVRWYWIFEFCPANPHSEILRWCCATVLPDDDTLPSYGVSRVSDRQRHELTYKNIWPIAYDDSARRVQFGSSGIFISFSALDKRAPCEECLKKCCEEQCARERCNRVCPKFLPPPFVAFSVAIIFIACGLYIQGIGWRAPCQSYRCWVPVLVGVLVMGFGWFGLFFGDWWSPIICLIGRQI